MSYRLFLLLAIPAIVFTAKGNAQKAYVGLGINLLTKDKIYFDSDYVNPNVSIMYYGNNPMISYDLGFTYIAKENIAIPAIVRFNSQNKLSFCPGIGLLFTEYKDALDLGIGFSPGFSFNMYKFKIKLSGSYFYGLIKQSYAEQHSGGTVTLKDHNYHFMVDFNVCYQIF